jgi:hypothetical protein
MSMRFRLPIACLLCGLVAGCGLSGSYPSLAPRPGEAGQASVPACGQAGGCGPAAANQQPTSRPAPPAALDPALKAQLDRLVGEARAGEQTFRATLPATERAVASAGAAGSDSWAEAQQALSRLETSRTSTTVAAAELDALARARIDAAPSSTQADLGAINEAADQVRPLVSEQDRAIDRLSAALPNP